MIADDQHENQMGCYQLQNIPLDIFLNAALYLVYVLLTHISGKVLFFLLSEKLFFVSMFQIRDCPIIFVRMTVKSFLLLLQQEFLPYFVTIHALYIVPEEL